MVLGKKEEASLGPERAIVLWFLSQLKRLVNGAKQKRTSTRLKLLLSIEDTTNVTALLHTIDTFSL